MKVSKRIKVVFDLKSMASQQTICAAAHDALVAVWKSFANVPGAVSKILSFVAGNGKRGYSAKRGSFLAHSANHESRRGKSRAAADSGSFMISGTHQSPTHFFPGAFDPRDDRGQCYLYTVGPNGVDD